MSTVAAITVQQCDGCGQLMVLQSIDDHDLFARAWYDGTAVHFCPACKIKPEHQAAIFDDQQLMIDIADAVRESVATVG